MMLIVFNFGLVSIEEREREKESEREQKFKNKLNREKILMNDENFLFYF